MSHFCIPKTGQDVACIGCNMWRVKNKASCHVKTIAKLKSPLQASCSPICEYQLKIVFEGFKNKLCEFCTKMDKKIVSNWTCFLDCHDLKEFDLSVQMFFSFQLCSLFTMVISWVRDDRALVTKFWPLKDCNAMGSFPLSNGNITVYNFMCIAAADIKGWQITTGKRAVAYDFKLKTWSPNFLTP